MKKDPKLITTDPFGALAQFLRTLQLVWRLLLDPRVPIFPKLIIPVAVLYVLSPIDLVPDLILGLGQIDDIAIVFLGIRLFIDFCPPAIVQEHRLALAGLTRPPSNSEDVIEGTFKVVSDEDEHSSR